MARFIQADNIVPSANTSQALNRYSYVKNNPLKFTDPSGHGWFSKIWKKIKKWIGAIITIALFIINPFAGYWWASLAYSAIGSAVGAAVSGGSWKSFAVGVGISIAAAGVASAVGGFLAGGSEAWAQALGVGGWAGVSTKVLYAAMSGTSSGAISSVVYGGSTGKAMLGGLLGGLTGFAASRMIASAVAFGASVIKELIETLLPGDLIAGFGKSARVTYKTIDAEGKKRTYKEKWYGKNIEDDHFEKMLDNVIAKKEKITFFEYVGHGLEGDLFYGNTMLGSSQVRQGSPLGLSDKILKAFSKQATIELEACQSVYGSDSVSRSFKEILPESHVFGYTGKAKPFWFFGSGWESFRWGSKWVEVK